MAAPTGKSPAEFIPGYTSDGTNITIPIASLPGLTSALAAYDTGDVRAVLSALLDIIISQSDLSPFALGQSCTVSVSPEVQASGLTRKTYTVRILSQPAAYEFADVATLWE
jgi:hypothetical protein